ncbi:uncharacterized protein E5676_scaffold605G00400 [Cucumis melo var. makuwa]|uniref:Retrotransposon protein n=1 Tax=Cucumis melo var. makuwa TaxID=1194695 RepID=A0A5D3DIZ5_CUCMM|nr:uncharacterized protein E5676_scaffold605G00400 [Cucumis melo var. makuwa]
MIRIWTVSILKARKLIKKGHIAYLALDNQETRNDLRSVPIICELDVFPKKMNGLSLKREIEFTIEVVARTTPISQTLYYMAPSELKGLKDQLKELLKKGYIRSSNSPWRAPVLFVRRKMD